MSEVRNYIGNKQYSSEIELYTDDLKKYADEVKSYNLTNLENIMLVIDDMWNNIHGYGTPNIDTIACLGLDISKENGVGVCRNMSDDIARKLNLINSKYNARVLGTYVDAENFELANIEQKINNEVTDSGINDIADISLENMKENVKESMEKLVGNHAIILMDIPNTDTHLIVDPTNPSIGVFYNGKIIVFNSIGKNGIKEYPVSTANAKLKGFKGLLELPIDYIKSISSEDLEILEQQYGLKAQNDALDKVRSLRNNNKDNEFLLSLKYDVNKNSVFKSNTQRTLMNSDRSDIDR